MTASSLAYLVTVLLLARATVEVKTGVSCSWPTCGSKRAAEPSAKAAGDHKIAGGQGFT